MKYAIGLDIGIASVGSAVVALDYDENPYGIIELNSRIFDVAENPKDGASLALPRRELRSARRRLRRHRHRLERIKNLLLSYSIISETQLEHLYDSQLANVYELRVLALDKSIDNTNLARILIHLAQRRGFKSNRKSESADKEVGQLLQAVNENSKRMHEKGYRTIGEMFFKDEFFSEYKRNKGGNYRTTVAREEIANEALLILEKQASFGNLQLTEDFRNKYLSILTSQRNFDEGPGGNSPYGGNQIENMIGFCTFEKDEPRAAKACYSFEYFNLLQKINHLRLIVNGENISLDNQQRHKLIVLAKSKTDINYTHIRKELCLTERTLFNGLNYDADILDVEKKFKFNFMPFYHQLRKVLEKHKKGYFNNIEPAILDEIGRILTIFKSDNKRIEYLQKLQIPQDVIEALLTISGISKFSHLSCKSLRKIIPYLEQGMIYNEACSAAYYNFRAHDNNQKNILLPTHTEEMETITSPVARRAIAQSIKVINAIIRKQGESPVYINIELAREMSKNFDERKKLTKNMEENHVRNERLMDELKNTYKIMNPSGMDLLKLKLYQEQDGISPYSQKPISLQKLFEIGYVDIDHIVPYSISFDDTFNNKVLVFSSENRNKGNRLPLQYLKSQSQETANRFQVYVNNSVKNYRKRQKLLKETITDEDINRFKERNLQDTKTISRFLHNYINDYLLFASSDTGKKKRVTAVNGAITSYLRKRWGISKNRNDGDKHHAVDALVVACTTDSMIRELSAYSNNHEMEYAHTATESLMVNPTTGEIIKRFPYPWPDFRQELQARLSDNPSAALQKLQLTFYSTKDLNTIKPIFISRMPRRKVKGAAHKATIKSLDSIQNLAVTKTALTNLKLDKNGEIANYYNPESDTLLYTALKKELKRHSGNANLAFANGFCKPKSDGTPGPLVKKVKVYEKSTLNVPVQQNTAIADNDSMVRIDIFKVAGDGYYAVPIYVADTLKKSLPNKAVVAYKPYAEWPEMQEKDFIFSLYPNDLIFVKPKKEMTFSRVAKENSLPVNINATEKLVYYKTLNIATGAIGIVTHDNTYIIKGLGIKTLLSLEKYQVDVLGNYSKVTKEKRQHFNIKR